MNKNPSLINASLFLALLNFWACSDQTAFPVPEEDDSQKLQPYEWMFEQRAYPYQTVNRQAYKEAFKITRLARSEATNRGPGEWELAGPVNVGGRITDLALHPTDQNIIYAGTSEGGIFKSADGGIQWQAVFENIGSNSIGDLALAPSDPDIIYAGTGEANGSFISGAFFGDGVYKSTDGGASWTFTGLENSNHIGRIAVDPQDPDRVFVAAAGVLYGKNDERGLYRSLDGGDTWENILFISDSTACIDVVLNPVNPNIVYAATWERIRRPWGRQYGGITSGVYRSFDGGENWEPLTNGLPEINEETGRIGLAISPSQPNSVYAVFTTNPITNTFNGIYRSDDAGTSWTRIDNGDINIGSVFASFGWFFGNIRVSPTDPDDIWCLGLPLLRTFNNGQTWINPSTTMHVDFHALEIHPENPSFIVAGNDGGVYYSTDNGGTWTHVQSLPINMFYTCEIDNLQPERIYGGTQDNGTLRTLTGNTDDWESILGGDGFHVIVDPEDNNFIYAEYQFGSLARSDNGGANMELIFNGNNDRTNWNTPVVLDPSNSKTLYYGAHRLYRSTDRGDNWDLISDDLTDGQHPSGTQSYGTITTIAVAPTDGNTIYAGTDDGNVQVTFNGGSDWDNISSGLPDRYVTRVAVHPEDPLQAFVTLSGFRKTDYQPHVLFTSNGGTNWEDISGNLPEIPVNDIIVHPDFPNLLFIANDMGVWFSTNTGENWEILGNNLPQSIVTDIDLHPATNTLAAATFGRSILTFDISAITPVETKEVSTVSNIALTVFPNPVREQATLQLDLKKATRGKVSIHQLNGQTVQRLTEQYFMKGIQEINWNCSQLPAGTYIVRLQTEEGIFTRKAVKE